jgi:hypothetical protein
MSIDALRQRVPTTTCATCRKQFKPGDRVVTVFIVQNLGRNPAARAELGAFLGEDFELAHQDCRNPGLDGRLITS